MFRKKWFIALVVVVLLGAVAGANFYFKKSEAITINAEGVKKRDLEAIVTASGTIQAKRFVNISAVQMGRVTRLAVEEGDRVKAGQFLLEIDPNALRGHSGTRRGLGRRGAGRPRAGPREHRNGEGEPAAGARPGEAAARPCGRSS